MEQMQIENNKLTFWNKIVFSISKPDAYKSFVKESGGKAVLYLFLIALIFGAIGLTRTVIEFNSGVSEITKIYNEKCPDFELKDGLLSVSGDMPMLLSDEKDYFVMIDTTNSTDPSILDSYDEGILILKDKMIEKKNNAQTQTIDFAALNQLTLNKASVNRLLPLLKVIVPFIYVFGILFIFIGGLLSALVLALFGLIPNSGCKAKLQYSDLFKMSVYALTASLLVNTLLDLIGVTIPHFFWIYHIAAFVYVCLALNKIGKENQQVI